MLPFDNKSEFQVVLDLPEGATLETSQRRGRRRWRPTSRTVPEVVSTETYAGTAAPFNFNGLVRHYFMRRGANVADVQVNLLPKGERDRQSHDIAVAVRPAVDSIARALRRQRQDRRDPARPAGALDAGGRGLRRRRQHAARGGRRGSRQVLETTPGVVDVDWTVEAPQARLRLPGGSGARRARRGRASSRSRRCSRWRSRAPTPGWPRAARRARAWPSCRGSALASRSGVEALLAAAGGHAARARRRWRGSSRWTPRPARPLRDAEEPAPGHLRDRRRGRHDRVAGVRDPRDEPARSTRVRVEGAAIAPLQRACSPTGSTRRRSSGTASGR